MHVRARRPRPREGTKEWCSRAGAEKRGKLISSFPPFGAIALPPVTRLSEIARWLDYLDISSWAILFTFLSISCTPTRARSLSLSLFPFSRTASWTACRKLDAYYFTRCRREFPSLDIFFSLAHEFTMYLFLALVRALFRALVYTHFPTSQRSFHYPFSLPFIVIGLVVCFS